MKRLRSTRGFTLIELLIAVLIIGILAAIALPAFNKQRERAKDSAAQQGLEAGLRAAKAVYAEGESFPASGLGALLGRAERSQSFAEASIFPVTAGTINVQRASASRVILRSLSTSGNQHMLSLDEPDSRVLRYSPGAEATSGTLPTYTNLVPNPSVETDFGGWNHQPSLCPMTTARQTSWSSSGSYSTRLTCGPLTGTGYVWMRTPTGTSGIPVTPDASYWLSARVRNYSVGSTGYLQNIRIYWYDSAGVQIATSNLAGDTNQRVGERTFSAHAIAPTGAAYAMVGVYMAGTTGDTVDFAADSVMLVATDKRLGYFDGDSPAASWTGAAHGSTSTGLAPLPGSGW